MFINFITGIVEVESVRQRESSWYDMEEAHLLRGFR